MADEQEVETATEAVPKALDPEILKILVENLKATITQVERYMLIALGASIFFLALALAQPPGKDNNPSVDLHSDYLPGPVPVSTAKDFALFAYIAVTWLATIYLARADRIVALLRSYSPMHLQATLTYPSIATIRSFAIRLSPAIVPLLLFAYAAYRFDYLPVNSGRAFAWIMFAAPALAVVSYLWRPMGNFQWDSFSD